MPTIGRPYTCGIWTVRDGSEEEFVKRWTAMVQSGHGVPGSGTFTLIQDRQDRHRFISFADWEDWSVADGWRQTDAFAERMGSCRELCEDFRPNDSNLRVVLGG
jgi:heme-degrading monooxygenase HmoA